MINHLAYTLFWHDTKCSVIDIGNLIGFKCLKLVQNNVGHQYSVAIFGVIALVVSVNKKIGTNAVSEAVC